MVTPGAHGSTVPIGITMGDPAGIGPEVALAAAATVAEPVVILGDPDAITRRALDLGVELPLRVIESIDEWSADDRPGAWCLRCTEVAGEPRVGQPRPADALAALDCIRAGAGLAASGAIDALVTAPVSKNAIAGHEPSFLGHTEYLATLAGVAHPIMLFAAPRSESHPAAADIALLTTHLPLLTALSLVRTPLLTAMLIQLSGEWDAAFGHRPAIGVAALNPHAGEAGRLGTEESRVLYPAMLAAREAGIEVHGPFPADSIFLRPGLDLVLALYHDQGTILAKRAPWPTVNVTLGLPYARTSPDHGTAYEIAGTGSASPQAMIEAVRLAAYLAARRRGTRD